MILHGCYGKMGKTVTMVAKEMEDVEIVAGVDCAIKKETVGYPVYSALSKVREHADVIVDFASAMATNALLQEAVSRRIPVVLCSTGHTPQQEQEIHQAAKEIPILKSANMSLGINLLQYLIKEAAKTLFPLEFDAEIVERHHRKKLDAPSGTALLLADALKEVQQGMCHYVFDRSKEKKPREQDEIGIASVRGGTIVGEHEVIFAGTDEVIELKHTAYARSIFAKGAIYAAQFLIDCKPGRYTMQDAIQAR